jgi:hypothetical protein
MNLDEDILNYYISSFFLPFLLYSSLLPANKSKHKKKCHQGSNTSGSKNLKETLLIIINSQAYHHESPAKYQPGTNLVGQASQPASCSITKCMHRGVKSQDTNKQEIE